MAAEMKLKSIWKFFYCQIFCLIPTIIICITAQSIPTTSTPLLVNAACELDVECDKLPQICVTCSYNTSCNYGDETSINCTVKSSVKCRGDRSFTKNIRCSYCYQLPKELHICKGNAQKFCKVPVSPQERMLVNCTIKDTIYCMGTRNFRKSLPCNWTSGYRWSTAMLLSVTLGGFGVDRFYLGHWKEGLGKVFSFGGLGVWTLVDIVLIAVGYVGPADGSLYIF